MAFNIFGIDLGSSNLKIAVIEKGFRGFEVTELATRDVTGLGEEALAQVLMRTMGELGYDEGEDQIAAIYPGAKLSSRTIDIPLTSRRQIVETLPFELEAQTPFDSEDFVCDFIELPSKEEGVSRVFAMIALKKTIEKYLNLFELANLDPDFIIPSPLAALAILDETSERAVALDIGARSVVITILSFGSPVSAHTVSFGVSDIYPSAGSDERSMENALGRRLFGDENDEWSGAIDKFALKLGLEVKRCFISANVEEDKLANTDIFVSGGPGASHRLLDALSEATGATVQKLGPSLNGVDVDEGLASIRRSPDTMFVNAVGGAMRVADRGKHQQVSLRLGEFEKKARFAGDRSQAIVAAVFFLVAITLGLATFVMDGIELEAKYSGLKNDIRKEFKLALPEVKKIVAESQQLKNALAKLDEKSKLMGSALMDNDPYLDRLLDLSRAVPEGVTLDVEELTYEWGSMKMLGKTESFEKVEQLKNNIRKLGWALEVVVEHAKASSSGGAIRFRLNIKIVS